MIVHLHLQPGHVQQLTRQTETTPIHTCQQLCRHSWRGAVCEGDNGKHKVGKGD